jgi:hypothetical protein
MPKQSFDHTEFIEGKLRQSKQIGWDEQVTLEKGPRSLMLMQARQIDHNDGHRGIRLHITKFTKQKNTTPFEEKIDLEIGEDAIPILFDYLNRQQALMGVKLGSPYVAMEVNGSKHNFSDNDWHAFSSLLITLNENNQFEKLLADGLLTIETLTNIGAASQHLRYKDALSILKNLLETQTNEQVFHNWFKAHPWILGTHYSKLVDVRRIGLHEISDLVMQTTDGYCDLFELKRPDMEVLRFDSSHKNYYFSADTSMAIAQCANYIKTTEENRHMLVQSEGTLFLKPRARIIMGRSNDWDQPKQNALRTLNGSLHFIEVWTYDLLLEMSEQMVTMYDKPPSLHGSEKDLTPKVENDDDLPF